VHVVYMYIVQVHMQSTELHELNVTARLVLMMDKTLIVFVAYV